MIAAAVTGRQDLPAIVKEAGMEDRQAVTITVREEAVMAAGTIGPDRPGTAAAQETVTIVKEAGIIVKEDLLQDVTAAGTTEIEDRQPAEMAAGITDLRQAATDVRIRPGTADPRAAGMTTVRETVMAAGTTGPESTVRPREEITGKTVTIEGRRTAVAAVTGAEEALLARTGPCLSKKAAAAAATATRLTGSTAGTMTAVTAAKTVRIRIAVAKTTAGTMQRPTIITESRNRARSRRLRHPRGRKVPRRRQSATLLFPIPFL